MLLDADTPVITIVGKTWLLHVHEVLRVKPDENLAMIAAGRAAGPDSLVNGLMCIHTTFTCPPPFIERAFALAVEREIPGHHVIDVMAPDTNSPLPSAELMARYHPSTPLRRPLVGRESIFDVTRCRYAEMYRALGIPELGTVLSCNRDAALIEGFNPDVTFVRTQTLMHGATHCDFRYRRKTPGAFTSA